MVPGELQEVLLGTFWSVIFQDLGLLPICLGIRLCNPLLLSCYVRHSVDNRGTMSWWLSLPYLLEKSDSYLLNKATAKLRFLTRLFPGMSSAWCFIVNELSDSRSNPIEAHKPEQDISHVQEQSVPTTLYRRRVCLPHEALFFLSEGGGLSPTNAFLLGLIFKQEDSRSKPSYRSVWRKYIWVAFRSS